MAKGKSKGTKETKTFEKTPAHLIPDYKPSRNLMPSVSKSAKLMSGGKRSAILAFGEAEENFKKNGRLILAKG